jgi:hypothetical protein
VQVGRRTNGFLDGTLVEDLELGQLVDDPQPEVRNVVGAGVAPPNGQRLQLRVLLQRQLHNTINK